MAKNVMIFSDTIQMARELVSAGRAVAGGGVVSAVVVKDADLAQQVAATGVDVINVTDASLVDAASAGSAIAKAAERASADVVLVPSTRRGKLVAGYAAQVARAGFVANVDALELSGDVVVAKRNVLGGALVAQQTAATDVGVYAVSAKVFDPAANADAGACQDVALGAATAATKLVDRAPKQSGSADIASAERLVVVGMGVSDNDMDTARQIADKLGAVVACTKPVATDRKIFDENVVVGISGKVCKPELALLVGISGQVQFYTGIRDAKLIAAVDKDENAPIFGLADYLIQGDSGQFLADMAAVL